MNPTDIRYALDAALSGSEVDDFDVRSFEDAGLMTYDEGIVVRDSDGNEFQITIVQSR